jgi:hypothetical protein
MNKENKKKKRVAHNDAQKSCPKKFRFDATHGMFDSVSVKNSL